MRLDEVLEELAEAVPEIRGDMAETLEAWGGTPPPTLIMSTIGRAYAREANALSDSSRQRFFTVVDAALLNAEDAIKDSVATGLLEAVVSAVARRGGDRLAVVDNWVGPLAGAYLEAWERPASTPE